MFSGVEKFEALHDRIYVDCNLLVILNQVQPNTQACELSSINPLSTER